MSVSYTHLSRRTGADDGYLVGVGLARGVEHLGLHAGGGVELALGEELLDLVDGDGGVHVAAGAGLLAEARTHTSTHSREGVLAPDELQSLVKTALGGELYVALDGDVRRALRLAGGSAVGGDIAAVGAVVRVCLLYASRCV